MREPWGFAEPPETEVITLRRILEGKAPVRIVTHDEEDGGWQFVDGDHVFEDDGEAVRLGEIVQLDETLHDLADLPLGWHAWRESVLEPWRRSEGDPPNQLPPIPGHETS